MYGCLYIGVRGSPERDISSLGTLAGWGLARLERPSAAAAPGLAWLGHFGKQKCIFNFGMVSGASAVHGMIRLELLISTNEFSRPHLLWHAGIFK